LVFILVGAVQGLLIFGRPASADDAKHILVALRPHDEDEATDNGTDRDKPVLRLGVCLVENLEIVSP
jgi:hypothetical protein